MQHRVITGSSVESLSERHVISSHIYTAVCENVIILTVKLYLESKHGDFFYSNSLTRRSEDSAFGQYWKTIPQFDLNIMNVIVPEKSYVYLTQTFQCNFVLKSFHDLNKILSV